MKREKFRETKVKRDGKKSLEKSKDVWEVYKKKEYKDTSTDKEIDHV